MCHPVKTKRFNQQIKKPKDKKEPKEKKKINLETWINENNFYIKRNLDNFGHYQGPPVDIIKYTLFYNEKSLLDRLYPNFTTLENINIFSKKYRIKVDFDENKFNKLKKENSNILLENFDFDKYQKTIHDFAKKERYNNQYYKFILQDSIDKTKIDNSTSIKLKYYYQ